MFCAVGRRRLVRALVNERESVGRKMSESSSQGTCGDFLLKPEVLVCEREDLNRLFAYATRNFPSKRVSLPVEYSHVKHFSIACLHSSILNEIEETETMKS